MIAVVRIAAGANALVYVGSAIVVFAAVSVAFAVVSVAFANVVVDVFGVEIGLFLRFGDPSSASSFGQRARHRVFGDRVIARQIFGFAVAKESRSVFSRDFRATNHLKLGP